MRGKKEDSEVARAKNQEKRNPEALWTKRKKTLLTKAHAYFQEGGTEVRGVQVNSERELANYVAPHLIKCAKHKYTQQQQYNARQTQRFHVGNDGRYTEEYVEDTQRPRGRWMKTLRFILYNPQCLKDRASYMYDQVGRPDVMALIGTRDQSDGELTVRKVSGEGTFGYIWAREKTNIYE